MKKKRRNIENKEEKSWHMRDECKDVRDNIERNNEN